MTEGFDYKQYQDLAGTGYEDRQPVSPEEEFFHSVYIAGQTRKNHAEITEEAGKLQIRGVDYNKTEVHFVITHVKKVLAKISRDQRGKETVDCFSFKENPNPPWFGYNGRQCGENSAARSADGFCNPCREQIIVAGVYCDANGSPITVEGRPIFVFIRGKGMKYNNVSKYLGELYGEDFEPIIQPVTEGSKDFEKKVLNNKRFVTVLKVGYADSAYGQKQVFELSRGAQNSKDDVMTILELSKKTLERFNEKFDWSKPNADYTPSQSSQQQAGPTPDQQIPDPTPKTESVAGESGGTPAGEVLEKPAETGQAGNSNQQPAPGGGSKPYSFEDINF